MSDNVTYLPIRHIQVLERQRKEFDIDALLELQTSIDQEGLFHPIVVNEVNEKYELVAGERRLRAITALQLGGVKVKHGTSLTPPGLVPCTVFKDMTEEQKFSAELSENLKRRDLTWQEKSAALAKLHAFRKIENPKQTYEETAEEVKKSAGRVGPVQSQERMAVREAEILEPFLGDEDVRKAKSSKEALKLVNKKMMKEFDDALDLSTIDGFGGDEQVHTLYHADVMDFLSLYATTAPHDLVGSVDVVVTDPPYGIGVDKFGGAQAQKHEYSEEDYEELYKATVEHCNNLCKAAAHAYIFLDLKMFEKTKAWFESFDWKVRRTPLIWWKGPRGHLADGGTLGYRREYEFILYAFRGARQCNALLPDVLKVVDHSNEKHHAAQKPAELYQMLMEQSGNLGDHVLDLFAGSGVVFEAADDAGMIATGIELSEKAVKLIELKHGVSRHV